MLEGVTTDNASAVVATARALSRADVSASWVATAEARSQRLPLSLPDSCNCQVGVYVLEVQDGCACMSRATTCCTGL